LLTQRPSGFKALCTTNLPEPTIADGSTVMDVALYTGNGSTQTISGLNFSPDFLWIKSRSTAQDNNVFDAVRGVAGNYYALQTNATSAEGQYGTVIFPH
jgi:type II secretory pathway component PulL